MQFIDASDYIERIGQNTGGTRAKTLLQSPDDGRDWFFKCSEYKPAKDGKPEKYYKYEFWSEVIASEIGVLLGIDVLAYYPAIFGKKIGCISPHMITPEEENAKLTEVGRYMTLIDHSFLPDDRISRKRYTFQLLESTITTFGLERFWPYFFTTLIFDGLIGNTDRHQENWAFLERNISVKFDQAFISQPNPLELDVTDVIRMAPVYDNGSSLGRELSDERVEQLMNDPRQLSAYVDNGKSELHWNGSKITHFDLIGNLLNTPYADMVRQTALCLNNWDEQGMKNIINLVDSSVPDEWKGYCIPAARKALIIKILTLRAFKLREMLS